ncbi:MAG: UpxY family transcription antiterminator [Bacteroidota bacterium]|nr:MAG: UpxY family transcription antiterminator [Bacteroidota bacterium]
MQLKTAIPRSWYAVYTRSRAEKKVFCHLSWQGIDAFLPIQKTLRQWSDRKKMVHLPLIRSYVFVKTYFHEYHKIIQTEGVVNLVCFEGKPMEITQRQIDNLVLLVNSDAEIETSCGIFLPGQRVEVMVGSLAGLTGELIETARGRRVRVCLDHFEQNLLVNIPTSHLKCELAERAS